MLIVLCIPVVISFGGLMCLVASFKGFLDRLLVGGRLCVSIAVVLRLCGGFWIV